MVPFSLNTQKVHVQDTIWHATQEQQVLPETPLLTSDAMILLFLQTVQSFLLLQKHKGLITENKDF